MSSQQYWYVQGCPIPESCSRGSWGKVQKWTFDGEQAMKECESFSLDRHMSCRFVNQFSEPHMNGPLDDLVVLSQTRTSSGLGCVAAK
jgi:hypothetical protein